MRKILCLSLALGFAASVFAQQQQFVPAQQQQFVPAQQQPAPAQQPPPQQFVPDPYQQQQAVPQQQFVPAQQQFVSDPYQQQQQFMPDPYQQQQFVPQQQQVFVPAPQPTAAAAPKTDGGEFRFGLYGAISSTPVLNNFLDITNLGKLGKVGLLFDLPNAVELGLGLSFARYSQTLNANRNGVTQDFDISFTFVDFTPGISYELGKRNLTNYGIGLDISLGYISVDADSDDSVPSSISTGWNIAFFPNFNLELEVFKNLNVGLKTGFIVTMPPEETDVISTTAKDTYNHMLIDLKTEIFASFYL
jgi:hypothetical protein